MQATAVILAAGLGTRMKSSLPKTLHRLAGRSMLRHLLASSEQVFNRITVVLGPDMDLVRQEAAPHASVVQHDRLGTAHAALQAIEHFGEGRVAVLYADNPLIRPATMQRLLENTPDGGLSLLAFHTTAPNRYGRVITTDSMVERIVEYADASSAERQVTLCNAGVLCANATDMSRWLRAVRNDNSKGEYYLTDLVALARAEGRPVHAVEAPDAELVGINSRSELAQAEATLQSWLRTAAMDTGVTMTDPGSVFLSYDTQLASDVTIEPNVFFGPGVKVASNVTIRAFSHIEGATIGENSIIGPFARLRPGAELEKSVHVGNFVEIKASHMGEGAKANHLTYVGDATVGAHTNLGAGTITCNYDGVHKHKTTIGSNAFIGSDVSLIAPVTVGDDAYIATGSVITDDVEPGALAIARQRQITKPQRALRYRKDKA